MFTLLKILFVLFVIFLLYLCRPFKISKDSLYCFLGIPGTGKTSLASFLSKTYKGYKSKDGLVHKYVYSNVPIKGTFKISKFDIGKFDISKGMLIVDEAGIDYNNRQFKALGMDTIEWAKYFRHHEIFNFAMFSQGLDIDVTFLRLAHKVYILLPLKGLNKLGFVAFIGLRKRLGPNDRAEIVDGYTYKFSDIHLIYCKPYWKYFDTLDVKELPHKDFALWGTESKFEDSNASAP